MFDTALSRTPEQLKGYLDEVCGSDAALRAEIEDLLRAYQEAPDFFENLAASVFDQDPMIGRTISRYTIRERLGGGGMGVVYLADDNRLQRPVALKFLPPSWSRDEGARARFEQEARAASSLDHPNICTIYEIGETSDDRLFIAMAYYEGETLKKKIARGPLAPQTALAYAGQMARGLAAAHARGIIHRDIKPANVMVNAPVHSGTGGGLVKIVDFGLAKLAGGGQLTQTGVTMGTVAYMSPEQARGTPVDARTDVWSLGVVLYEMLTGERPFRGEYEQAILYAILNESPPPVADVPPAPAHIIARCLEKDPDRRYASAAELEADLERAGREPDMPARRPSRWLQLLRVAGIVLLVVMGLWFGLQSILSDPGSDPRVFRSVSAADPVGIGVMGFQTIGDAGTTAGLAGGLEVTLSSQLALLQQYQLGFWVIPETEIPDTMTAHEAYLRFGIGLAVRGSVQGFEEGIRLTVNVVDAFTGRVVGTHQVDTWEHANGMALQDQVVEAVFDLLSVPIPDEARGVLAHGKTRVAGANEYYLRGLGYLRDYQTAADLDTAIVLFEKALVQDDAFALAHAGQGEAYWRKYGLTNDTRWVDEAIRYSRQALALNDRLSQVHVTLGIIYNGRQRYDEALQAYERALALDPRNEEAHRRQARVYYSLGDYEKAEAGYRQAIALKQGYWRGYNSLGVFYLYTGRLDEAITTFNRGLAVAPENQSLLNNRAIVYWNLGNVDETVSGFEQTLRVNPRYGRARRNLARAYFYQGRYPEAAAYFEAQYGLQPDNYTSPANLANAWYWIPEKRTQALDKYREALGLARQHLKVRPEDVSLLGSLATYYARLARPDSALLLLHQIEGLSQPEQVTPAVAFGVGELYEDLGRRTRALTWIESALARGHGRMELTHSPWLKDLRETDAYRALAARYAL